MPLARDSTSCGPYHNPTLHDHAERENKRPSDQQHVAAAGIRSGWRLRRGWHDSLCRAGAWPRHGPDGDDGLLFTPINSCTVMVPRSTLHLRSTKTTNSTAANGLGRVGHVGGGSRCGESRAGTCSKAASAGQGTSRRRDHRRALQRRARSRAAVTSRGQSAATGAVPSVSLPHSQPPPAAQLSAPPPRAASRWNSSSQVTAAAQRRWSAGHWRARRRGPAQAEKGWRAEMVLGRNGVADEGRRAREI